MILVSFLSLCRIIHPIYKLSFAFQNLFIIEKIIFVVILFIYFWEDFPYVYSTFILHLIPLGGHFLLVHLFSFIYSLFFSHQFLIYLFLFLSS